jgi:hypothetical protein
MSHASRFSSLRLTLPPAPKLIADCRPMVVHAERAYVSMIGIAGLVITMIVCSIWQMVN